MFRCCVCGCRTADGVRSFGEFVCIECHFEATGERIHKPITEVLPRGVRIKAPRGITSNDIRRKQTKHLKRSQIRYDLMMMNVKNRIARECL